MSKLVRSDMSFYKKEYLSEQLKLSALVFEESLEGIMITDANNNILRVNEAFSEMTGYREDEIIGLQANVLKSDVNTNSFYKKMWKSLHEKGQWRGEIWNRTKDSTSIACFLSIKALYDVEGNVKNYIAMYLDITEKKQIEDEIYNLAYHDTLTKLSNRTQLNFHLTNLINKKTRDEKSFALLLLDLDNFKNVNDSYGHNIGDLLLIKVAKILKKTLRKIDFIARIGGDEFTIVIDDYKNVQYIQKLCQRVIENLSQEFKIKRNKFSIGCSIGVAVYPKDGKNKNSLLKSADIALYKSKADGKNTYTFHTNKMNKEVQRKLKIDYEIDNALRFGEFEMVYQPKLCLKNNTVIGAEALLRWNSPVLGPVSPIELITHAEESGAIINIGKFVFANVFKNISHIQNQFSDIRVSINISSVQLKDDSFYDTVISMINSTGVNPGFIEFEITETAIMHNINDNIEKLLKLKELGISISIDDFGTGYSSMNYLQKLPVDIIKIDKSFVESIGVSKDDEVLIRAIISLSKEMNMKTIAEGVETKAQCESLEKIGCDSIQGYYYSKPLEFRSFLEFLEQKSSSL